MTHQQVAKATGVGASTFHRWQRGDFKEAPELDRVRAFCAGLGVSPVEALAALGVNEARDNPEPDPPMPPEVIAILRRLADPNVSARDKLVIREMLRMLAGQRPAVDPPAEEAS